ncbi:Na+/H+ antiporter NhaD/arsenite permease-like protein [Streptomyces sp. SAI-170]
MTVGVLLKFCAVVRPFPRPEAAFAVPAAAVVVAVGATPWEDVREEAARLGPVIGFLAAVLVLGKLCDDECLFHACGTWTARWAHRRPRRLLGAVFALASAITAVLSRGRHGGPADPGRLRHGSPDGRPAQAARARERPPVLTYAGSLATLLWRRIAHRHDIALRDFTLLGLLTVPTALLASTLELWASPGVLRP